MAKGHTGYPASQGESGNPRGFLKKLPEILKEKLTGTDKKPFLLLFQDEARFGRISDPSRCWAPRPFRPMVLKALVREFRYVYAALGPQEGTLDWMVAEAMNTDLMGTFLAQVGAAHPDQEVVMVFDGASPHRAKGLVVPDNIRLVCLPPYSPELNPTEILWHELREKFCANRVFDTLDAVIDQVKKGLEIFSEQREFVSRLSGWPWIVNSILLNAK